MLINEVNDNSSSGVVPDVTSIAIMEHYGLLSWHYNYRNPEVTPAD